jgi:hypothetical protein
MPEAIGKRREGRSLRYKAYGMRQSRGDGFKVKGIE